jgi:hypothetical protein
MPTVLQVTMHQNLLSGTVPPQWSTLAAVTQLRIDDNSLWGTLPQSWQVRDIMHKSGTVPCLGGKMGPRSVIRPQSCVLQEK